MDYLVSIVIPIYNVEKYIDKCICSVKNQTYKNLEIILVNDGSPDNCKEIIENYSKLDSRIKIINKNNGGLSDARNAGLNLATGDYICFIDGDDYVELDMVEQSINKLNKSNSDVLIFSFYNEDVDLYENIIERNIVELNQNDPNSMLAIVGYAWNKMYKTSYIKSNKFLFEKGLSLVEDVVFNENIIENTNKIDYINKPLYHYISRMRTTLAKQYYDDSYNLIKKGFNSRKNIMFKLFGINKKLKEIMAESYINGIRYCCSNMFFYKNSLSFKDKYTNLKNILNDNETIDQIKFYRDKTLFDKLIKISIKYRQVFLLYIMYYIRSFFIVMPK